jgi:hypothetical protein
LPDCTLFSRKDPRKGGERPVENRVLKRGSVEMSVVCSDLSLLESINTLLRDNGVIAVEDDFGILHYIVDARNNRKEAAGKVTSISSQDGSASERNKEEAFLDVCIKTVLREYGFDMSLIGSNLIYNAVYSSFRRGVPLPPTMKSLYVESSREYGLSLQQAERDVRYAIMRSSLTKMRSRAVVRCIQSRIERRMGLRDPLEWK